MKRYDVGRSPNPRRLRNCRVEKGIKVDTRQIDIGALEHKAPAYTAINPLQRVPALVLDDGTILTESVAICRYFEALQPQPPLFGRDGREAAIVEMWNRRVEHGLLFTVAQVLRHLNPGMKILEDPQIASWGELNKPRVMEFLALLAGELASRPYVAGAQVSVADIPALVAVDVMKPAKLAVPDDMSNVRRWHADVAARPSAGA